MHHCIKFILPVRSLSCLPLGRLTCGTTVMSRNKLSRIALPSVQTSNFSTCLKRNSEYHDNVFLMGSPGSGKTSVGRLVGHLLGRPTVDIDNDHLEKYWGMSVANKLADVGSENFVEAEGQALLDFKTESSVVSLSGSNPMYKDAMEYIKKSGVVVFLDVQHDDVLSRLEKMKVNRIVGQNDSMSMLDILKYRQQFYEGNYDIRIICEENETTESVAQKIAKAVVDYEQPPQYRSTRTESDFDQTRKSNSSGKSFNDVVLEGLARDGGLYVPSGSLPKLSAGEWERLVPLSYSERALRILEKLIHPKDLHPSLLGEFVEKAYNAHNFNCHKIVPVVHLENNHYLMELFHGPTASFKDAALQLMPMFFLHAMQRANSTNRYLIVVATSGDTGGAVLDGFGKLSASSGVLVTVLYPEEGISAIQKAQMTTARGQNVHVVGVKSDFDFCQTSIKQIFRNTDLTESLLHEHSTRLSAANSINWGRLIPQVVYHASSYLDLVLKRDISFGDPVDLCIPTGNFGNIIGAFYAKEMGIPFRKLICASNSNNILTQFFNTGSYDISGRQLHMTSAPAIDILKSSNLERFLHHTIGSPGVVAKYYQDLEKHKKFQVGSEILADMQEVFAADWCEEALCLDTIKQVYNRTGYLMDPHTAIAKAVADRSNDATCPMLIASTAHPSKFATEVLRALGHSVSSSMPPEDSFQLLEQYKPIPLQHEALVDSVTRDRVHQQVVKANMNDIVTQIQSFLQNHGS